jgi:Na+:H+ antiporter, NhaA family
MATTTTRGHSPDPPEAWPALRRFWRSAGRPLDQFLHIEAASGVVLLIAAAIAMAWANSRWADGYRHFWHTPLGVRIGGVAFERPLEWFVNDGLMAIFFFVVGMEIRREIHDGELSSWQRAALPAAAALGGMLAPAALYLLLAGGVPALRSGWGVPMATDIAFAVGILGLLGARVPAALRVLLLALAVIDDLGAIIVIAAFYSAGIQPSGLLVAAAGIAGVFVLQRSGVRAKLAYVPPALVAWGGVYAAGIHPTIAGVIVGLSTPVRAWRGPEGFTRDVRLALARLEPSPEHVHSTPLAARALGASLELVGRARREALSPAEALISALHPWVAFGIMPTFALANAGVAISGGPPVTGSSRLIIAVVVGLVLGKPLGVLLASWLTLRSKLGTLPVGMTLRHLVVLGMVAGVGFTMALFIAQLAFADATLLSAAKLGILIASGSAATLGWGLGRWLLPPVDPVDSAGAASAGGTDDAERSTRP